MELSGVVRVRSKKNNSYFTSTPLTCATLSGLVWGWEMGGREVGPVVLDGEVAGREIVEGVGGVEGVSSLVWSVQCEGCGSQVTRSGCSYVGCRVVGRLYYSISAVITVLLGDKIITVISTSEEDVRAMIGADESDWRSCKERVVAEGRITLKTDSLLDRLVQALVSSAGYFVLTARRLRDSQDGSFFCLKAWKPSITVLNGLYEDALQ